MAYSTPAEVKDSDISRLVAQAAWVDADVQERIDEGDAVINGYLAGAGYALPFTTTPALVKQLSILYARYAILRDMHHNFAPSQAGGKGYEGYKEQFDKLIEKLLEGKLDLVDAALEVIDPTLVASDQRVLVNTEEVPRALTMDEPEGEHIDDCAYSDPSVIGGPEDVG
jgi:phage gp36-like protein